MEIREAVEMKRGTEKAILGLLHELESKTGCSVSGWRVQSVRGMGMFNVRVESVEIDLAI